MKRPGRCTIDPSTRSQTATNQSEANKNNPGTRIFLIRHATTAKVGKSLTGWLPGVPLDDPGRIQADNLIPRFEGVKLDQVWSSPLQRTLETAAPLAASRNIVVRTNNDLGEVNFGDWQGRTLDSLQDEEEFHLFNSYRSGTRAPGGELMLETQARMVRGLLQIAQLHTGENVAVFSHADAIKCVLMHALGMPIDFHYRLEIEPASVTILHFFREIVRVIRVNTQGIVKYYHQD